MISFDVGRMRVKIYDKLSNTDELAVHARIFMSSVNYSLVRVLLKMSNEERCFLKLHIFPYLKVRKKKKFNSKRVK